MIHLRSPSAFRFLRRPPLLRASQAVIVQLPDGVPSLDALTELEQLLQNAINESGAGELDRHQVATDFSDVSFFMHGPNADVLLATIRPILESTPFITNATVLLQYGPAGENAREITIRGVASGDPPRQHP